MSGLSRLEDHLYVFEDTCLVYLLVDGEHGLLVDSGSGAVLDELESVGVRQIDWVLHTHHHRDQCQGDARLIDHGALLAVPKHEVPLFAEVEQFWDSRHLMHRYDLGSERFTLRQSVPVAATLDDYGAFHWGPHAFRVLPAPGHTKGSIVLLTEVDGKTMAFTGDLIASPGKLWQIHPLQWSYGGGVGILDGVQPAAQALADLRAARPDRLLPSHGEVIEDHEAAIDELLANLRALVRYWETDANDATLISRPVGLVADRHLVQISDHLWMNQYSFANSYVLIADSGNALFLDYGYPTFHHFLGGFRFAEHSLRELAARAGLRHVDLVIPSHYHDDHIGGIPYLQETFGARVWAHEIMVDLLEHPSTYNLPCLLPQPIRVQRSLQDGEVFSWEEFQLQIAHTPGHTFYHAGLFLEVDGLRVALTGDTLHAGMAGPILGGPIYQNRFRPGDFELSIQRLREWHPDLLLTGHTGVAEVDSAWLEVASRRACGADEGLYTLSMLPDEVRLALDPSWVSLHPYEQTMSPGDDFEITAHVRNPGRAAHAVIALQVPGGWTVDPCRAAIEIPAGEEGELRFSLRIPDDWTRAGTMVICADVTLDDGTAMRRFGEIAEGLVHTNTERGSLPELPGETEDLTGDLSVVSEGAIGHDPLLP
jgi:glyoxylase-like metal-dependent hydrolase (beta-lactamase superfamily II)